MKATPNARRSEIIGWTTEGLRVKVQAPALDGRANEALCAFMAQQLGLPRSAVELVRGSKSRTKLVEVRGMAPSRVRLLLSGG